MKLLDLFCGAGGCAVGYNRAGFDIVGVDHAPQLRYPFPFLEADALDFLRCLLAGSSSLGFRLEDFDAIHASPPCQRFSCAQRLYGRSHPDLLTPVRGLLIQTGKPWVIENVVGAPMQSPVVVCGSAFGLKVRRHRLFEASFPLVGSECYHEKQIDKIVNGKKKFGWFTVYGGGRSKDGGDRPHDGRRRANAKEAAQAMGINWMVRDEMSQAIPPAYTEFIGQQLKKAIE